MRSTPPARGSDGPTLGRRWRLRGLVVLAVLALSVWPIRHAGTMLLINEEVDSPDALIMLASHEWERLPAAAALARRYPLATVLLTVPVKISGYNCYRCDERTEWLQAEGVPAARVQVIELPAANTYGEAKAALAHTIRLPFRRLLIVTSTYHTRRALATFKYVFRNTPVQIGVVAAEPAQGHPERWWATAYDRHYVRYEWAALPYYWLRFGVQPF